MKTIELVSMKEKVKDEQTIYLLSKKLLEEVIKDMARFKEDGIYEGATGFTFYGKVIKK